MSTSQQSFTNKARNDKFILVISPPLALAETAKELGLNDLQISIFGSPVPRISVPAETVDWKGQQYKVTSMSRESYDEIDVDFTIDNDFKNYWFLWKWLDIMNKVEDTGMDPYFNQYKNFDQTNILASRDAKDTVQKVTHNEIVNKVNGKSVYPDYQVDMVVFGLDEYNNKKIKFTYTNAFITNLGEINYSYRDPDEAQCSMSFAFSQLKAELVGIC